MSKLFDYLGDLSGPEYAFLGHFRQRAFIEAGHNVAFGRTGVQEDLEIGPQDTGDKGQRARTDTEMLQPYDDTADNIERPALSEKWHESESGMQKSERGVPKERGA